MKKLLLLIALMVPFSSYAKDLIQDFEWLEPNNTIEIVVGEPYQLHFSCSNNNLAFTSAYADSWVHIDFTGGQHVVDPPTGYSIDENGVITGMVAGSYALHPTGWVQAKSGVNKWLYITVVSESAEIEPNNTLDTANDITSKIRFGLYNISDIDFFKYTNNNLKWGDEVTFKIHYYGSRETPFGYKWSTFCGTDIVGGGSLINQDQECKALVTSSNTVYLEVYYNQSRSEYFLYGEVFVAEVFINGVPASEYEDGNAYCGEGVTYTLVDGTLTISKPGSGSGNMYDYSQRGAPWYSERNQIKHIVVESGVKSIGDNAFEACQYLESVTLSEGLEYIHIGAFNNCGMKEITIPNSVIEIGHSAFIHCTKLDKVVLGSNLERILSNVFSNALVNDVYCYAPIPPEITSSSFDVKNRLYVPSESVNLYKMTPIWSEFSVLPIEGEQNTINGHEYVDLGLPSGNLWAKNNYGASSEGDYGIYMDWPLRNAIQDNWGNEWSTPTSNDIVELYNNCSFSWEYNANGIYGCKVTGNNGNFIFLPAAGFQLDGFTFSNGSSIFYWDDNEYEIGFAGCITGSLEDGISLTTTYNYNYTRMPIRPVVSNNSLQPYAALSDNNTVLTFYYDTKKIARKGMSVGPIAYDEVHYKPLSEWNEYSSSIKTVVFDNSFADYHDITSTAYWFESFSNLEEIIGLNNLNTENVTDMKRMFIWCSSLTSLDLSNFNTANVTDMSHMFQHCSSLKELNFETFNTKNVVNMHQMFHGCSSVTFLDLSSFDTGNVTDMGLMFYQCDNLETLDLSNFNTENVTAMYVFDTCPKLKTIYVNNDWNTEKVSETEFVFYKCYSLIGGQGTKWKDGEIWPIYARIDRGPSAPGYFTKKSSQLINGHEYVDLGLPSGKCWATTNYGADIPEDYGSYLEWSEYNQISYNWGSEWQTPSLEDIRELENNCSWTWETKNGHNGYTVTGSNGNSIFLPACGFKMIGQSNAQRPNEWVYYWTSTQSGNMAYIIMSTSSDVWYGEMNTSVTLLPIRPITKDSHTTEDENNKCGDNLTWRYSVENKTLIISGTGAMWDYSTDQPAPWNMFKSEFEKIVIEDGVTTIGKLAFYECNNVKSIDIPQSVNIIGDTAFGGCINLASVNISDLASWCQITCGPWSSNPLYYAHHLYLNGEEIKDLVIPSSISYIGESAFWGCSGLTSVTIPTNIAKIKDYAFADCTGLTAVYISDFESWLNISFMDASSNPLCYAHHLYLNGEEIKDLVIPNGVSSISEYSFWGWSGLKSLTIPKSVSSIGANSLRECTGLQSIVVEEGNSVFDSRNNCNALIESSTNILRTGCVKTVIPNSILEISSFAFYGIPISSISIPNSVTSLGSYTFASCSELQTIVVGNGLNTIWSKTFEGCQSLTDFYIYSEIIAREYKYYVGSDCFYNSNVSNATLHVPASCIDDFKTSSPWYQFGNIVALTDSDPKPTSIEKVRGKMSDEKGAYYDLNGRRLKGEPTQKGVYIHNGKKVIVK